MDKRALCILFSVAVATCGGSSNSAPTSPTPSTPVQANRAPVINSLTFSPSFGISQLSTFAFNASATDPDGDAITYTWDVAGNPFTGTSGSVTFSNGFSGIAKLTVSDSKGASTSDTRSFVVGSMAGTWTGSLNGIPITATLAQPAAGLITGTWVFPTVSFSGILDPATVNKIDAAGNATMRYKVSQGRFDDFTITGTMDQTGALFIGVANGSGFSGSPIVLRK